MEQQPRRHREAAEAAALMERILYEVKRVVVGQDPFLERVLVATLAQGHLLVEGVESSIGTYALHLLSFYRRTCGHEPDDFPVARALFERTLSLPIYRGMTEADVAHVAEALRHA